MKVLLGKVIQTKLAAEGLSIPMVKGTAEAIQNPICVHSSSTLGRPSYANLLAFTKALSKACCACAGNLILEPCPEAD
jgi:hypothetical protein